MKFRPEIGVALLFIGVALAFAFSAEQPSKPLGQAVEIIKDEKPVKTLSEQVIEKATYAEKTSLKADAIVSLVSAETFVKDGIEVEIQSIEKIEGGVAVYARAWRNGEPVGFGKDGTVEIERFLIYNPPIMVPDGTTREEYLSLFDRTITRNNFKEDPKEALRIVLVQLIEGFKFDGSKIETGKVGRTTSTFYPAAAGVSPVDGFVVNAPGSTNWDTVRDGTSGSVASNADTQGNPYTRRTAAGNHEISRVFTTFDTSTITDTDVVSSSTIFLYNEGTNVNDNDGDDVIRVSSSTPAATNDIVQDDYDQCGTTAFATDKDLSSSFTAATYNSWGLNASGIANITLTGVSKFCFSEGHDAKDSGPLASNNQWNYLISSAADNGGAGTTQDPKLVVEHAAGATPSQNPPPQVILFE